jgi:hypothetical protein
MKLSVKISHVYSIFIQHALYAFLVKISVTIALTIFFNYAIYVTTGEFTKRSANFFI